MRRILHIVTVSEDSLSEKLISLQREQAEFSVQVIDLTRPDANYRELLDEIFAADSIEVW